MRFRFAFETLLNNTWTVSSVVLLSYLLKLICATRFVIGIVHTPSGIRTIEKRSRVVVTHGDDGNAHTYYRKVPTFVAKMLRWRVSNSTWWKRASCECVFTRVWDVDGVDAKIDRSSQSSNFSGQNLYRNGVLKPFSTFVNWIICNI